MATAVAIPVTVVLTLLVNHSGLNDEGGGKRADAGHPTSTASGQSGGSGSGSHGGQPGSDGGGGGPSGSALPSEVDQLPPTEVPGPARSAAADQYCPGFVAALPITLDGLSPRPTHSDSPYVGSWGDPAVTFRCGVPRPAELGPTSELVEVNGVQWLPRQADDATVFVAVDRPVYVELTVPKRYSGGPLAGLTPAVTKALPATEVKVR